VGLIVRASALGVGKEKCSKSNQTKVGENAVDANVPSRVAGVSTIAHKS
jgi:hypothetical protein